MSTDHESLHCDELEQLLESLDCESKIDSAIEEIPKQEAKVKCYFCDKVCASERGLKRHLKGKHPDEGGATSSSSTPSKTIEELLHPSVFKEMITHSVTQLSRDECYPDSVLNEFKSLNTDSMDILPCYVLIKDVVLKFSSRANAEKFYPEFYNVFDDPDLNVFQDLGHHCTMLLGFELANQVLSHLTGSTIVNDSIVFKHENVKFTDKEKSIITYLSGYVVGTFYRRLRFSKQQKGMYHQQSLSILLGCKMKEGSETNTDTSNQKLTDLRNRGGLWRVTSDAVAIFSIAESYFLAATKDFVSKIDANHLVSLLVSDACLLSYYGNIRRSSEQEVKMEIATNLLEDMLLLYIRVRSHSYAKDQQQLHKMKKGGTKAKSLRTEIKKKSSALDSGH